MRDLRRLYPYIRPYRGLLILSVLLLFGNALLEGAIVVLLGPIFNAWSGGPTIADQESFRTFIDWLGLGQDPLFKIPVYLILFALIKGVFLYAAEVSMSFTGQQVVASLRSRMHEHLLQQSMAFFSAASTGQLMARLITDTERIQESVSKTLTDVARQAILLLTFLALLLYIDWRLTLATFALVPLVAAIVFKLGQRLRKVALRSQKNLADISAALQETIVGQRIVKAFSMEGFEQQRFEGMVQRQARNNLGVARIIAVSSPLMDVLGYLAFAPLLFYASYQIQSGNGLTLGEIATFIVALIRLYDPLRRLSRIHLQFQQAFASSERIFELLDRPADLQEAPQPIDLPPFSREIRFENAGLQYDSHRQAAALKGIDLTIGQGETVALVGSSGAGKSSLAGLIPRFYDATQGRILVDGIDVRQATLLSLRRQVAMVTQETFLFNDTLRNNIAYGQQDLPQQRIEEAARAAYIHDFIASMHQGYQTVVGERGEQLSGGQRQRIAIARAVLKNAPILILDEATSALDSESERLVQKALENLMRHSTTVVIAHRLSTVRQADRIVVLEAGCIAEVGDHKSLLQRSGVYRKLYELQFEEREGDRKTENGRK